MPHLGTVPSLPYAQTNVGALQMLAQSLDSTFQQMLQGKELLRQMKGREADQAAMSDLANLAQSDAPDRGSALLTIMERHPESPFARQVSLQGIHQMMQPKYGTAPWHQDPRYSGAPGAQVAAGLKPPAVATRPRSPYGEVPWHQRPDLSKTPAAQVAAGLKPRAATTKPSEDLEGKQIDRLLDQYWKLIGRYDSFVAGSKGKSPDELTGAEKRYAEMIPGVQKQIDIVLKKLKARGWIPPETEEAAAQPASRPAQAQPWPADKAFQKGTIYQAPNGQIVRYIGDEKFQVIR
ncbi:MAG TPA: hypothetical protein VM223_08735 [Planctomycetota bacterium]|nr:hypothetical protein [Planctomycetota bacterium]